MKLEVRHLVFVRHQPWSGLGAQATECAADQDAFWPYHDQLFAVAESTGRRGFAVERLTAYAEQLGLDQSRFVQCMNEQTYATMIDESAAEAMALNIQSTPSVLVNDQRMENAFEYEVLAATINEQLRAP